MGTANPRVTSEHFGLTEDGLIFDSDYCRPQGFSVAYWLNGAFNQEGGERPFVGRCLDGLLWGISKHVVWGVGLLCRHFFLNSLFKVT